MFGDLALFGDLGYNLCLATCVSGNCSIAEATIATIATVALAT